MAKRRSSLRNRLEASLVRTFLSLVSRRSPESAERLGRRLGLLARHLLPGRRRLAERNLARAYPQKTPAEVAALAREVFAHFGVLAADLFRAVSRPVEETLARVEVVGLEEALAASRTGRGVLFVTPHLGNWEYAALVTGAGGMPSTVIARPLDNPLLDALLTDFRRRTGNRVVPKTEAAREVLRTLRHGGTIGILPDQHAHPPDAVVVPFFGRPASTTSAVARFAARTEALVVTAACVRTGPARWRMTYLPPLDVRTLPEEERGVEALTARISRILEGMVREQPSQWLWLHNRWRLD